MKKYKNRIQWAIIIVIGIIAVSSIALASYGGIRNIILESGAIMNYTEAPNADSVVPNTGEEEVGATINGIIYSRFLNVNGINEWYSSQTMKTATTTLCSIVNPKGTATTTLVSFSIDIITGTSTASTVVMATSTSQYATTTTGNLITAQTVAASSPLQTMYRPAVGINGQGTIIGPSEYLLVKTEGAGLSGYTYVGTCKAVFRDF